ncbi:MAG: hypothetical protein ACYC6O_05715 [Thermoleophilia bacterium]
MGITTIIPPKTVICPDVIRNDVLNCLKRQPNIPVSVEEMSGNIAGVSPLQIERALHAIEGPVTGVDGRDGAYVHRCRCTNAAIYIT